MAIAINRAFLSISRRAEQNSPEQLVQTFVDIGLLFTQLSSRDHQLIFGRRGTGKTHVLYYLGERARSEGDVAVYIDLRQVGSTGGLYADVSTPLSVRGTTLLVDVLSTIHDQLMDYVLSVTFSSDRAFELACQAVDRLAAEATTVRVVGTEERESKVTDTHSTGRSASLTIKLAKDPTVTTEARDDMTASESSETRVAVKGEARHHVVFGGIAAALTSLMEVLPAARLWVLLDEWSTIPTDLQPYLADVLKRCIFPVSGISVKIAAIKERSSFQAPSPSGGYIGMELGADVFGDTDLDDFMVFGNDADRAKQFFGELLFRHVVAVIGSSREDQLQIQSSGDLIRNGFTQASAFDELVKAAEGVPRDAINVLGLAAMRANDKSIGVPHVRSAARTWYVRDKQPVIAADSDARLLLYWIIDRVIGERRARAFLVRQGLVPDAQILNRLYDARVLHVVKRGVSARDYPGVRFDVYSIDYGSYVDLINTAKAPQGLFAADVGSGDVFIEVPQDDYRSIRRAVLDLTQFAKFRFTASVEELTGLLIPIAAELESKIDPHIAEWVVDQFLQTEEEAK